jgi:RimJ/RimL family protein N-acetyltransferase
MTEDDADDLRRLSLNPNVNRFLGEQPLADRAAALAILHERIFPQYRDHSVGRWAIVPRGSPALIGWCGLKYLPETDDYDLGYRLLEEEWRKGYATEAARAVLDWARTHLVGKRIIGKALVENVASIHVLQKLGLRFEGERVEEFGPTAVYSIEA